MNVSQWKEITAKEMQQLKVEALCIGLNESQIMDFAGLQLARFVEQQYPRVSKPLLLIGPGGNGLHGLASARFLQLFGYNPLLLFLYPKQKLSDLAFDYLQIATALKIPLYFSTDANSQLALKEADIFLDALLGYGGNGGVREPLATLINQVNASYKPTISIDLPSGFHTCHSDSNEVCIKADQTLTFISPKQHFSDKKRSQYLGDLYLAEEGELDHFMKLS